MLNLSDKELDRLSREAANEHDPGGSMLSPGAWDKLEWRLDRELGKVSSPGPTGGIRRIPYFYAAPAILLLAAVSYYIIKTEKKGARTPLSASPAVTSKTESSGSPPPAIGKAGNSGTATNDHSSKSSDYSNNSTSTTARGRSTVTLHGDDLARLSRSNGSAAESPAHAHAHAPANGNHAAHVPYDDPNPAHDNNRTPGSLISAGATASGSIVHHGKKSITGAGHPESSTLTSVADGIPSDNSSTAVPREAAWSFVQGRVSLTKPPRVNDSALRAFTAIEGPIHPDKKNNHSLHVNRSLHFGLLIAPDFASVNSLAGYKPGSSFGLTVDYQFANRWYISSGLLFSQKNYTARAQDFHAPPSFYQANSLYNVNLVKGSLNMLEVPLNIRYDFSVANNTVFFLSAGTSSYLRTNETCNYYFPYFGREVYVPFKYTPNANYLFSSINLSFGVEAGVSNSVSILVAPYMKFPTGGNGIGFGQIQVSSVGINFGVKYAPVLSRKRK
jgi:Outer membrane protein beta-barrel domain